MRDINILFSTPMVKAQLADLKTMTRREVKGDALAWLENDYSRIYVADPANRLSPYGYAGDTLLTRETFFAWGRWETRHSAKKGRDEWHFVDMTHESGRQYLYAADNANYAANLGANQGRGVYPAWWKRPAIFMPRAAVRIRRRITAVRIERLQDISAEDALAEGIVRQPDGGYGLADTTHYHATSPIESYRSLWEAINGDGSVMANPFVWCISFAPIDERSRVA